MVFSAIYLTIVALHFGRSEGGFGALAEVSLLFRKPYNLLAGWIHYLAFDLFIGSWEVRDAQRLGVPHLLVIPCLIMTLLLGPVGLMMYFILRLTKRRVFVDEV